MNSLVIYTANRGRQSTKAGASKLSIDPPETSAGDLTQADGSAAHSSTSRTRFHSDRRPSGLMVPRSLVRPRALTARTTRPASPAALAAAARSS